MNLLANSRPGKVVAAIMTLTAGGWLHSAGVLAKQAAAAATATAESSPASMPTFAAPQPLADLEPTDDPYASRNLTEDERAILGDIQDGGRQIDETGLYVLLRRAAAIKPLPAGRMEQLNVISPEDLLARPERYRAEPMVLHVAVWEVRKWTVGNQLSSSLWWPKDKPVWQLASTDATGKHPTGASMIILTTADPSELLGQPNRVGSDGELVYTTPKAVQVAGLFHKIYLRQSNAGDMLYYPVVIAWQLQSPGRPAAPSSPGAFGSRQMLLLGIGAAAIFFAIYRMKMKRAQQQREDDRLTEQAGIWNAGQAGEIPAEDVCVDPELKAAAEQYRKEHPGEPHDNR